METLLYIILGFVVGFYLGKIMMRVQLTLAFIMMLKDLKISEQDLRNLQNKLKGELDPEAAAENSSEELDVIEIKLEQHSGVIYAFRKDNDQFLGQGANQEDLVRRLGEKMRNVRLLISREDGGELMGGRSWEYNTQDKTVK
jgi:hypothetical protein